ncbi:MAG TPA: hypothetical protein VGK19_18185 [Capsulimonadaceae bacterium]|jgi:hypothetical protein
MNITMPTNRTNTSASDPPVSRLRRRVPFALLLFGGLLALAVTIRVVFVFPWLNYYSYQDDSKWTTYEHPYTAYIVEPVKYKPGFPDYAYKGASVTCEYYKPMPTKQEALAYALLHAPLETSFGPFEWMWNERKSRFYDAHGLAISRPQSSQMPLFVARVHLRAEYVRHRRNAPIDMSELMFDWAEFRQLTNSDSSDTVAKDVPVRVAPGYGNAGMGSGTKCLWTEPAPRSDYNDRLGIARSAIVWFSSCWKDTHSKFYTRRGELMKKPPIDTGGDYEWVPRLTLLLDKRTHKVAGGYWWGEFHDRLN